MDRCGSRTVVYESIRPGGGRWQPSVAECRISQGSLLGMRHCRGCHPPRCPSNRHPNGTRIHRRIYLNAGRDEFISGRWDVAGPAMPMHSTLSSAIRPYSVVASRILHELSNNAPNRSIDRRRGRDNRGARRTRSRCRERDCVLSPHLLLTDDQVIRIPGCTALTTFARPFLALRRILILLEKQPDGRFYGLPRFFRFGELACRFHRWVTVKGQLPRFLDDRLPKYSSSEVAPRSPQ